MTQPKILTTHDIAEKAGITPAKLRRLLRNKFNRAGKTEVGRKRIEYRFDPGDPLVKQIISQTKGKLADKPKNAKKKASPKVQPKSQKPKDTKAEILNESVREKGESDDKKRNNS